MKIKINLFTILGIIVLICAFVAGFILLKNSTRSNETYCAKPIAQEKLIFVYSDGCPACGAMKPIMKKRDDVYWLNLGSNKCIGILEELNLGIEQIPTFACTKDPSIFTVGGRSEEEITNWIEENC